MSPHSQINSNNNNSNQLPKLWSEPTIPGRRITSPAVKAIYEPTVLPAKRYGSANITTINPKSSSNISREPTS
jgi:hypothetical protein